MSWSNLNCLIYIKIPGLVGNKCVLALHNGCTYGPELAFITYYTEVFPIHICT